MSQFVIRFLAGGLVVSIFALIADSLKPKSFAGLFGAAPSVALATLSLTLARDGAYYAGTEARSMMAGAIAFFVYASVVSRVMRRHKVKALWAVTGSMPVWFMVSFGLWHVWLK